MTNSFKKIVLSDKPTGHLLCRYYTSEEKIGYFALRPTKEAKKKILLASELFIIGSSHLKISSINIYYVGKFEPIYFIPNLSIDALIGNQLSIEKEMEQEYFHIEPFSMKSSLPILPSEATYYQVRNNSVTIECVCYPNLHQCSKLISMPIPFKNIFI